MVSSWIAQNIISWCGKHLGKNEVYQLITNLTRRSEMSIGWSQPNIIFVKNAANLDALLKMISYGLRGTSCGGLISRATRKPSSFTTRSSTKWGKWTRCVDSDANHQIRTTSFDIRCLTSQAPPSTGTGYWWPDLRRWWILARATTAIDSLLYAASWRDLFLLTRCNEWSVLWLIVFSLIFLLTPRYYPFIPVSTAHEVLDFCQSDRTWCLLLLPCLVLCRHCHPLHSKDDHRFP